MYFSNIVREYPTIFWNDSCEINELRKAIERGAKGATSNPTLVLRAILADKTRWDKKAKNIVSRKKDINDEEVAKILREGVIKEAAEELFPIYQKTNGKSGLVGVQVDPRRYKDTSAMVEEGLKLNKVAPNLYVKIPITAAGLKAIEILTEHGVSTDATTGFTVSQAVHTAIAYRRGLAKLATGKVHPKSFVVVVTGRLGDHLKEQAIAKGMEVESEDFNIASVAVAKKAYNVFKERRYESIILVAGMRTPQQVIEFVGGELILAVSPSVQEKVEELNPPPENRISMIPPEEVIVSLKKNFPDFCCAYDENGLSPEEMGSFGPCVKTEKGFIKDHENLINFVKESRETYG